MRVGKVRDTLPSPPTAHLEVAPEEAHGRGRRGGVREGCTRHRGLGEPPLRRQAGGKGAGGRRGRSSSSDTSFPPIVPCTCLQHDAPQRVQTSPSPPSSPARACSTTPPSECARNATLAVALSRRPAETMLVTTRRTASPSVRGSGVARAKEGAPTTTSKSPTDCSRGRGSGGGGSTSSSSRSSSSSSSGGEAAAAQGGVSLLVCCCPRTAWRVLRKGA